jgi:pyruvate/2-oxoglutarate/acetoin dehydrogenase E1 component
MLSKSKGQVLRLSAAFHILFCDTDIDLSEEGMEIEVAEVSTQAADSAIVAAQNFVDTCCQHAAFIAGRSNIDDEIIELSTGIVDHKKFNIV